MTGFKLKILLFLLVSGFLIALVKLEIPGNTFLSREINNAMHFPFFGVLSLLLLGLSSLFLDRVIRFRLQHYLAAFVMVIIIGGLHEYSQITGPRDADIRDLVRDAAGAVTFLGLFIIYDNKLKAIFEKRDHRIKLILFIGAVILIVSNFTPSALWGAAYLHRDRNFPTICDFESIWDYRFLKTQDAVLKRVSAPYIGGSTEDNMAGRLQFSLAEYPGLAIEEPYPDWSGHNSFDFIIYSEMDFAAKIGVRIEDSFHNNDYNDRYNGAFMVEPGMNNISISIDKVKKGPSTRNMDMNKIRAIHIFVHKPDEEFVLYFDNFRLD
jgi:VanZ family protein